MDILKIGKNMVELSKKIVEEKKNYWLEEYPDLKFDEYGRCIIPQKIENNNSTMEKIIDFFDTYSMPYNTEFVISFNEYLKNKKYKVLTVNNTYSEFIIEYKYLLNYEFLNNRFLFLTVQKDLEGREYEKIIQIKVTKVLAEVQKIWLKKVPKYENICYLIKKYRKEGYKSYDSKIQELNIEKEKLEKYNLYFIIQKIFNGKTKNDILYLSINPLDALTSSGETHSIENPTKFGSCMGLTMETINNYIKIEQNGCYSSPKVQFLLAQCFNRGIIFTTNGKTLKVPNTNFEFLGYSKRSNIWFDTKGILVERQYPDLNCLNYELKNSNLKIINEDSFNFSNVLDYSYSFNYVDIKKLRKVLDLKRELRHDIYLDKVLITKEGTSEDNINLIYLPQIRKLYNDMEDGIGYCTEKCNKCNENLYDSNDLYEENNEYYCYDCYNLDVCFECDKKSEDIKIVHLNNICPECLEKYYVECYECGDYEEKNDCTEVEGEYLCDYCLDDKSFICHECGDRYLNKNKTEAYHNGEEVEICEYCENHYTICSDCGELVHEDDIEEGLCNSCK